MCLFRMLLHTELRRAPNNYNRKFTYIEKKVFPKPLFPLVEGAYLEGIWDDLIRFINENERLLLEVCQNRQVTDHVRGRLFEMLVIWRLKRNSNQAKISIPGLTIPRRIKSRSEGLSGQVYATEIRPVFEFDSNVGAMCPEPCCC